MLRDASSRPLIVGILNVTPDSFSDGGRFDATEAAVTQARRMLAEGADIIDVGGESTRPGAGRIDVEEQIRRTIPVIEAINDDIAAETSHRPIISIDTTRAAVATAAIDAGASMINDVSAGREDAGIFTLAAERELPLVLMHMRGDPSTMQQDPHYQDVVTEVLDFLIERAAAAEDAGVLCENIILDPGIGFGKTTTHNIELLAAMHSFVETGYPVMLGASRKRFLGELISEPDPAHRDIATTATTVAGVIAGVRLFRVHDVKANRQAAQIAYAIQQAGGV